MADTSRTIQTIRENIKKELKGHYPEREINAMIDFLFGIRLHLKRHEAGLKRNEIPAPLDQQWFDRVIKSLKAGCPVQYIAGETEFFGLTLKITPAVLIPRQETEELVRWVIDTIPHPQPVILDIGTGSGCIALAIKKNIPGSQVFATDMDTAALKLASQNATNLAIDIQFLQHDILMESPPKNLPRLDIIVSNPPYIPEGEKESMATHVTAFEPSAALFVPDDNPLLFYASIANFSRQKLKEGGRIFLEVHEKYGKKVRDLLRAQDFSKVELRRDINAKERMVKATHS